MVTIHGREVLTRDRSSSVALVVHRSAPLVIEIAATEHTPSMAVSTRTSKSDASLSIATSPPRLSSTKAQKEDSNEGVETPWYIILPDAPGKVVWDAIAVILLLYTVIIVPLRIGFEVEDYCPSAIWIWELVIDMCFIFDLMLNFITGFYEDTASNTSSAPRAQRRSRTSNSLDSPQVAKDQSSKAGKSKDGRSTLNANPNAIAMQYLKSWFIIDFVSSVPVDSSLTLYFNGCVGIAKEATEHADLTFLRMVRIIRLIKLLKILRVLKLQNRMEDLGDRFPILTIMPLFALLRTCFLAGYIAHLLACGFYFVGSLAYYSASQDHTDISPTSWLTNALGVDMPPELGLKWSQIGAPYTACVYWTFTTITTVGCKLFT